MRRTQPGRSDDAPIGTGRPRSKKLPTEGWRRMSFRLRENEFRQLLARANAEQRHPMQLVRILVEKALAQRA